MQKGKVSWTDISQHSVITSFQIYIFYKLYILVLLFKPINIASLKDMKENKHLCIETT